VRRRASAFTLVEVLVWIATVAILMSLVGWLLVSMTDSMRQARGAVESATVRILVLERLGADVRSSVRILVQDGNRKSDEKSLILGRHASGDLESASSERVLYRFEGGTLYRETGTGGSARVIPVGRIGRLAFRYDEGGPGASRWMEVEMPGPGNRSFRARFYLLPAVAVTSPTNAEGTP
jgi:type II secretory pathway pseudopilin PulG